MYNRYHLVKVLDKKWTNSLLDGNVYFKAVQCFGDLQGRSEESSNSFRGDSLEGITCSDGDGFGLIDALTYREKLYCMYALDYDEYQGNFIKPDKRMLQFGDTAVVFYDSLEFLHRIMNRLLEKYNDDFWTAFDKVHYNVDFDFSRAYNEFSKTLHYSYQNEFRIVLDLAKGRFHPDILKRVTDFARLTFPGVIIQDTNEDSLSDTLIIDIGDIRDICITVPMEDLINNESIITGLPVPRPIPPCFPPRESYPTFFFMATKLP